MVFEIMPQTLYHFIILNQILILFLYHAVTAQYNPFFLLFQLVPFVYSNTKNCHKKQRQQKDPVQRDRRINRHDRQTDKI